MRGRTWICSTKFLERFKTWPYVFVQSKLEIIVLHTDVKQENVMAEVNGPTSFFVGVGTISPSIDGSFYSGLDSGACRVHMTGWLQVTREIQVKWCTIIGLYP